MAVLAAVALAGAVVAVFGHDEAPEVKAEPLRRCEVAGTGLRFRTGLSSCRVAIAKGIDLSVDAGFVSDPDAVGAGAAFAALCEVLQGDEKIIYDDHDGRELARKLHRSEVCPGKLANLDPTP